MVFLHLESLWWPSHIIKVVAYASHYPLLLSCGVYHNRWRHHAIVAEKVLAVRFYLKCECCQCYYWEHQQENTPQNGEVLRYQNCSMNHPLMTSCFVWSATRMTSAVIDCGNGMSNCGFTVMQGGTKLSLPMPKQQMAFFSLWNELQRLDHHANEKLVKGSVSMQHPPGWQMIERFDDTLWQLQNFLHLMLTSLTTLPDCDHHLACKWCLEFPS